MKHFYRVFIIASLLTCCTSQRLGATHLAGFDIQYTCINPLQDIYRVTLRLYTDGCGIALPASVTITVTSDFGQTMQYTFNSQSVTNVTPVCANFMSQTCCGGGPISCFMQGIYTGNVDLTGSNRWTLSAQDCCRNNAINNLQNPGAAGIYIETIYNTAISQPGNASVVFGRQPLIYACPDQQVYYQPLAQDADGDSLAFRFVAPRDNANINIGFVAPYNVANPFPVDTLIMDSHTGNLSFASPQPGNYVIAVAVDEYRNGVLIGTTFRDIQILILPPNVCAQMSQPPFITIDSVVGGSIQTGMIESDVWVCAGNDLSFSFVVTDADDDSLSFYNTLENQPNVDFTYSQNIAGDSIMGHVLIHTGGFLPGENFTYVVSAGDTSCPVNNALVHYFNIHVARLQLGTDREEICVGNNNEVHLSAMVFGYQNPLFSYEWSPVIGLDDPTSQNPVANLLQPVTYTVNYQQGACSLQDSVRINASYGSLLFPSDSVSAFVCIGDSVLLSPELGIPDLVSFENIDSAAVTPGTYTDFPIQVNGLPYQLISDQLASVCVNVGAGLTGQVNLYLIAPDGTQIILSTQNGGYGNQGYRNTCFDPLAATSITSYIFSPIPANIQVRPEGAGGFNNLNGHLANGTWYLRVQGTVNNGSAIMFRSVTLTFNTLVNPSLHWEPQTGLTCYDCPSPTAYVTQPTTWEVQASNVYGCLDTFLYSLTPIIDTSLCDSLVVPPYWVPRDENNPVLVSALPAATWAQPRLYPNPANQEVILEMDGPLRTGTVGFYNVTGQAVLTGSVTQKRSAFNVSGLPAGIYFVNVRYAGGGDWVGRLVVGR